MEPDQIGRYLIQERLGQGGMGTVYRGTDPQINRQVAVKTISISDPVRRARFQREVRAAARLMHPNIVTIFDAGEEGNTGFIVMELVEGETLAARLRRSLTWHQVVSLLLPVCQALDYAHGQGITHRDLKPANILITPQDIPKLTDFGLAHLSMETSLTPLGQILGTPGYIAPEQLRGQQSDHRSDIFSLGVILFEAVTGQHPFAAASVESTLYQIVRPEPVSLAPLAGKAPPALTQIIGQALAKERAARHATTADLAAALAECLSNPNSNAYRSLVSPQAYPTIRHTPNVSLSPSELALCAKAFSASQEVLIERELHAGLSGARVLLVRPGGRQAQVVVKLGPLPDLNREWIAYQSLVENFLPQNTARIPAEPIPSDDGRLALLRYTFAGGDPRQPTHSLRLYFQEQGGKAAADVLNRIFRVYGRQWWTQNEVRSFVLSEEYDRLLPVHLLLQKVDSSDLTNTSVLLIADKTNTATLRTLSPGQMVRLLNFSVAEVNLERGQLTLTAPSSSEASASLRLRVTGVDPLAYHPGDQLSELDATITATRHSLLTEAAQATIVGLEKAVAEIRVGETTCPNPLRNYLSLLDYVTDARFSIIHGDLNLENILVDSATGFAWLIDFAETRRGPALFDLQRLESQIVTKILAPTFEQSNLGPVIMVKLYQALHADLPNPTAPHPALQEAYILLIALRRLARQFLINDLEWDEYYRGLILTLLGTLKFTELSTTARTLALVGAGTAAGLRHTPLPAAAPIPKSAPVRRWSVRATLATLLLVITFIGVGWWMIARTTAQLAEVPLALLSSVAGRVEIRRHADDRVQSAAFGQNLFKEDAVLTYEEAAAYVMCQNGLLLKAGPEQVLVVRCQDTDGAQVVGRLDARLGAQLLQGSEALTLTLAPVETRAGRPDLDRVPLLLTPRNSTITEPRPNWRWTEVAEASGYRLNLVNAVTGEHWQTETTTTSLTYPADAPPLVPQQTYLTRLELLGTPDQADESFFSLLDESGQNEVAADVKAVEGLGLDPLAQTFLLARLYQKWELWTAAIAQQETIVTATPRPELAVQLANLYFQVGLYPQAEQTYQSALNLAQSTNDPAAQAPAMTGLGQVAVVYGEIEVALRHFQTAEQLYRAAGETFQAEGVTRLIAELSAPTPISPSGSPTP